MKTDDIPQSPIASHDDLLVPFVTATKPPSEYKIGAEMEKVGVTSAGGSIHYEGERGVRTILEALARTHGWNPERETHDGPLIALTRGAASITLEPGAQFELSGAPFRTIHEIDDEFRAHLTELGPISKELGIRWLGLGFHPFARRTDLTYVPKLRYGIMRDYLPKRGAHALDMMLRTCTVQANFDYRDEADAMKKLRVAMKLAPLTTALFANSPFYEGKRHGGVSFRGRVWLDVDPDRSGLVPSIWDPKSTFATYVEWALDAPMFMFKRGDAAIHNTGQTFRSFWKDGFEGHHATQVDWQTHLNTLFPEVRLKKTLEVRGADAQTTPYAAALPALWTGLLYDTRALDEAEALTASWTHDEVAAIRPELWQRGLATPFRGAPLAALAEKVIELAEGGLARRAFVRADGKDERVYLGPLRTLVGRGQTPAEALLAGLKSDAPAEIIARAELLP